VPWQKFVEARRRMIGNARQDIGEPGARIDIVQLR
jgi:hypothetical protein